MLSTGQQIERYRIEGLLGRGGMALVYAATHTRLGTQHALKVLKVPVASVRERLEQEGRIQAGLRHPNIVSVTDIVDVHGAPGLVMERVLGPSLAQVLEQRRLTLPEVDVIVRAVLAGVAEAHRRGLVHRDLKPGNVLIALDEGDVVVKVTDFGLARLLAPESVGMHTRSGMAMGTPAYMAPEQFRSARQVDARADVFSLGSMLYEMVSGHRTCEADSLVDILAAAEAERYPPLNPALPEAWRLAIVSALRPEPDERPSDASALLAALGGPLVGDLDWSWVAGIFLGDSAPGTDSTWSGGPMGGDPNPNPNPSLSPSPSPSHDETPLAVGRPTRTGAPSLEGPGATIASGQPGGTARPTLIAESGVGSGSDMGPLPTLVPGSHGPPWGRIGAALVAALVGLTLALLWLGQPSLTLTSGEPGDPKPDLAPADSPEALAAAADLDQAHTVAARAVLAALLPGVTDEGSVQATASVLADARPDDWPPRRTMVQTVLATTRAQGLPDVVVGIPGYESRFRVQAVSPTCAAGLWQFMPETAVNVGLAVSDCALEGESEPWSPGPGVVDIKHAPYSAERRCLLGSCLRDERLDVIASTAAAARELDSTWNLPELANHPQREALTVLGFAWGRARLLGRLASGPEGDFIEGMAICEGGNPCTGWRGELVGYSARVAGWAAVSLCYALPVEERPSELCAAAGLGFVGE
jgi:serine/threonine protein kinase